MALPTAEDNLHAMMYALDRMKRERCQKVSETDKGIRYIPKDQHRIYPCHRGLKDCQHGQCKIVTKEKCESLSQLPFDKVTGEDMNKIPCDPSTDTTSDAHHQQRQQPRPCPHHLTCDSKTKTCIPKYPYLEFNGHGQCVYGNFALLKWCEFPKARRMKEEPGITDVPPFHYNTITGQCEITKDYCDRMGVSFKIDAKNRPTCYSEIGQQIGEFFVGKTIFRGLKKSTEGKLLSKDFAGENVSLYLSDDNELSFAVKEVQQAYPELVVTGDDNDDYIRFTAEDLKHPAKKRLFFTLRHSKWISPVFIKIVHQHIK